MNIIPEKVEIETSILRPSNSGHGHFVEVKLSALEEGIKFKRGSV